MKNTFAQTIITTTANTVETIEVTDELIAYKLTQNISKNLPGSEVDILVTQGIANKTDLPVLLRGEYVSNELFFVASEEVLEGIRRFGFAALSEAAFEPLKQKHVFDHLDAGGSHNAILRFDRHRNIFWQVDGTIANFAIEMDYMAARVDDLHYDLAKVVELLWDRDDIIFIDDQPRFHELPTPLEKSRDAILRIPYWNAECGQSCVRFFWLPTREQLAKLFAKESFIHRYEIIFNDDMLGLRAGGAAKYSSFHESDEASREDVD